MAICFILGLISGILYGCSLGYELCHKYDDK